MFADLIDKLTQRVFKWCGNAKTGAALVEITNTVATKTGKNTSLTITRPDDTILYSAGDAVGGTGTGVSGAVLTFSLGATAGDVLEILSVEHRIDLSSIPAGMLGFKLHLYNSAPAAIADNAAWDLIAGDRSAYLGYLLLSVPEDMGSTLYAHDNFVNHCVKTLDGNLYGVLQTLGGYTPTALSTRQLSLYAKSV